MAELNTDAHGMGRYIVHFHVKEGYSEDVNSGNYELRPKLYDLSDYPVEPNDENGLSKHKLMMPGIFTSTEPELLEVPNIAYVYSSETTVTNANLIETIEPLLDKEKGILFKRLPVSYRVGSIPNNNTYFYPLQIYAKNVQDHVKSGTELEAEHPEYEDAYMGEDFTFWCKYTPKSNIRGSNTQCAFFTTYPPYPTSTSTTINNYKNNNPGSYFILYNQTFFLHFDDGKENVEITYKCSDIPKDVIDTTTEVDGFFPTLHLAVTRVKGKLRFYINGYKIHPSTYTSSKYTTKISPKSPTSSKLDTLTASYTANALTTFISLQNQPDTYTANGKSKAELIENIMFAYDAVEDNTVGYPYSGAMFYNSNTNKTLPIRLGATSELYRSSNKYDDAIHVAYLNNITICAGRGFYRFNSFNTMIPEDNVFPRPIMRLVYNNPETHTNLMAKFEEYDNEDDEYKKHKRLYFKTFKVRKDAEFKYDTSIMAKFGEYDNEKDPYKQHKRLYYDTNLMAEFGEYNNEDDEYKQHKRLYFKTEIKSAMEVKYDTNLMAEFGEYDNEKDPYKQHKRLYYDTNLMAEFGEYNNEDDEYKQHKRLYFKTDIKAILKTEFKTNLMAEFGEYDNEEDPYKKHKRLYYKTNLMAKFGEYDNEDDEYKQHKRLYFKTDVKAIISPSFKTNLMYRYVGEYNPETDDKDGRLKFKTDLRAIIAPKFRTNLMAMISTKIPTIYNRVRSIELYCPTELTILCYKVKIWAFVTNPLFRRLPNT